MSGEAVTELQSRDDVVLLVVQKRALNEPVTQQLVEDVHSAAAQLPRLPIVLDLTRVRFAPSVALGLLVQMSKSFKLDGRRLALIGVDRRVRESIGVTRLDRILEIHRTLDDVLGAPPGPDEGCRAERRTELMLAEPGHHIAHIAKGWNSAWLSSSGYLPMRVERRPKHDKAQDAS